MKFLNYNHTDLEPHILEYWQAEKIVEKVRKRNKDGKKFYFLDGPPYTSGKFHLGHAWNYALKDIFLRYKRMQGFNVWDRNGFDVHGLPTEHKVMDKYNLKTKEDIQQFGLDKFTEECEKFCLEMAEIMSNDLQRMGITVRITDPYMALSTEFMEGEWALIKKAYEQKRLYHGEKVLTWCQHCETAIAKHECEYKNVADKSIFVKFPVKGKKGEYLIIWTTTPWTIPFNLAIMAGPDLEYVKVDVNGEKWILAKALAGLVVQSVVGKKMKVMEEFKGKNLEGLEYSHPFEKYLPQYTQLKKKHPNVHTVILNEHYVDTMAGSGLVHAAPGCGPEDQEACKPYNIPPFNTLTEAGYFPPEMDIFAKRRAKIDDHYFTKALEEEGVLLATTFVEHDYPHCWRCHNPVIFRITFQWFFKVEDLREKIIKNNAKVHWNPDTAKHAYESWINNLKDNSISRQRYWGTPLPIWQCQKCNQIKVVSSREEIKKNGGIPPQNIHIPWIDKVTLKCTCNGIMKRVPDVIDVWVDAGTASWNCLDNNPDVIKKWFPADLIVEAKEQTRLWFSLLSICSYLYLGKNAFQNVYVYGMLNDIAGQKMSKSVGNIISPYELINKHGVDVLRYYMCQNNAGQDIKFSWEECKIKERQLHILWNIHKLLINLAHENDINPFRLNAESMEKLLSGEEKYIFSKLYSTINDVTQLMESYRADEIIRPLEELFLHLSRTYIQMVRDKSAIGSEKEKHVSMYTIATVLLETLKMFSLISPFISEAIYLNLKEEFGLDKDSISHYSWPESIKGKINRSLEQEMEIIQNIIQSALNAREKAKRGLRWPMSMMTVACRDKTVRNAVIKWQNILITQTNVKIVKAVEQMEGVTVEVKPNLGNIGKTHGSLSPHIIAKVEQENSQKMIADFEKKGHHTLSINGKNVRLTPEMIVITHHVPEGFVNAESKQGVVYLNTEITPQLEAEGYAREVMRQIQQLRKEAGLEKKDTINVNIAVSKTLQPQLEQFLKDIKEKVGAATISFKTQKEILKMKHHSDFTIKNEKVVAGFEKK